MFGSGYVGNGGFLSSSSSNLSPLAPPFTVDRSNPKTNTETPQPYGVPFSSSLHNWHYPQSSQPGTRYISYCGSGNDSPLPPASDYSPLSSELNNPPSVHWAPSNPNTSDPMSNPFSYGGVTKQYYAPYVSQAVNDKASLTGLNEDNYDLLSTSGFVPTVGSSQVDYSLGSSSLEYPPAWGGSWNGLSEGKRGKRTDIDGSFHLEGIDLPGSHAYQKYFKQGVVPVEYSWFKENHTATQSKHADGHGREMNAGFLAKEQLDNNLGQNFGFISTELSKARIFGTSTPSHLESPSLEPVAFSSNHHKSYSPYEKDTVASKSMDVGDVTDVNWKDGSSYKRALEKEPLLPPSSDLGFLDANHLGFHTGRNDQHIITAASSKENVLAKSFSMNSVDLAIKVRDHIPNINVPHGFSLSVDNAEAFKHATDNTETSDQHNPAEDSPCWKGAPASSVSPPFESSNPILPQNLMMKLEAGDSYDFEMTQTFPPNNESVMGSSSEVGESLSMDNNKLVPPMKNLGAILPTNEHSVADPARLMSESVEQIMSDRDQNLSNVKNQMKQYNRPLCPKEVNFMHKSKVQLQTGDGDAKISASDASEDGCIPLHTVENVLYSPPFEKDNGKLPAMASNPIVNVQTLADELHNISELLVLYNSGNGWGLKEQCSKTLEHAIHNINLCLSKRILQTPRQELLFPEANVSHLSEKGATKVRLHAMNEVGNATVSQLDSYSRHEQKRIHGLSDMKFEKNMDFDSSRNEADAIWHDNMVQNIKAVFDENFQSEEDISPESLLYKNLWLNAEAELCVTGLKTRFDQVKIQMENCKSDKTKEDAVVVDKIPSSSMPPEPIIDITSGSIPKAHVSPKQKAPIQCSGISSPGSDVKDVEASVMARFQILKWRGDNINTCNVDEKSLEDVTDLGIPCKIVESKTGSRSFDVTVGSRVRHHNDKKNIGSSS